MRLEVGGVYEWCEANGARPMIYACVAECVAETIRFKKQEPGYKLLILQNNHGVYAVNVGEAVVVPRGAHITVGVKRLD